MALEALADSTSIFRQYIERNARYALSIIAESSDHPLSRKKLTIALQALQYTLASPEFWPSSKQLLLALAPQMELLDLRVLWLPYLKQGLAQSIQFGDQEAELALRFYLGNFLRESNAYDEAIKQYQLGIALAEALGDVAMQVRLLNRCAFARRRKGQYSQAEHLARRALALADDDPVEQGYSHLVLGAIRFDLREWDECLEHAHQCLAIWLKHGARRQLAWGYTNLGVSQWRTGLKKEALKNLEMGVRFFEELGDIVHQASTKMNLGLVYYELNEFEKALELLTEAAKVFHAIQDKRRMAMVANNLAHVYQKLDNIDDAIDAFQQSISLWQSIGETAKALNVMHSLTNLLIESGELQHAKKLLQIAQLELAAIEGHSDYQRLLQSFKKLNAKAMAEMKERLEEDTNSPRLTK